MPVFYLLDRRRKVEARVIRDLLLAISSRRAALANDQNSLRINVMTCLPQ